MSNSFGEEQKQPTPVVSNGVQPKKPLTACFNFMMAIRPQVISENPQIATKVTEITKIIGQRWKELSEKQKKPYQDLADADKLRYARQLEEFEKKGWFTMDGGKKSCDLDSPQAQTSIKSLSKMPANTVVPKKGATAFMFFNQEIQPSIRA